MIIVAFLISLALIAFGVLLNARHFNPFDIVFSMFGVALLVLCIVLKYESDTPYAIDVYRGNTTLKITYVDSVAVDSVVVFKTK